jgi:hypothetical protein
VVHELRAEEVVVEDVFGQAAAPGLDWGFFFFLF